MSLGQKYLPGFAFILFLIWGSCAFGAQADACRDEAACTAAISAATGSDKAHLLMERARLLRRSGDLAGAEVDLEHAMMLAPDDADILVELGYLRRAQGDLNGQLAADAKALAIDPRNWRALLNHMDALASLGQDERCLKEALRAVELAPGQAYTYAYRGRCRAGIGQTAEAVEDYEKAIRLGLNEAFIYSNLALSRLDLGHNQQALDAALLALQRDPASEYGHYSRIDALIQLGRLDDAIKAYHEAMAAIEEDTLGLANLLAWELYRHDRAADALPIIEGFFKKHPNLKPGQIYEVDTYAHVLAAVGNKEAALRQFLAAVDLGGEEKAQVYRRQLELSKIMAAPGREGLATALAQCVEMGARCRLLNSN